MNCKQQTAYIPCRLQLVVMLKILIFAFVM